MNLLLLETSDLVAPDRAVVRDQRCHHVAAVLKVEAGDRIEAGLLGGARGWAVVLSVDRRRLDLELHLGEPAPPPLPVDLVLALPRPKFLGRILQSATSMGVKRVVLLDTARVQKSYWQSSLMAPAALRRHLLLGLEQARDTILPTLELAQRFDRFVSERLPAMLSGRLGLLAHGEAQQPFPRAPRGETLLLVGPEGGFLDHEVAALVGAGVVAASLGSRALRVETAVAALIGRLLPDPPAGTSGPQRRSEG